MDSFPILSEKGSVDWIDFDFVSDLARPLVILDTETTGLSHKDDRVIEFAGVKIFPGKSKALTVEVLINPYMPIPLGATQIHGITDDDVKDSPGFSEIAEDLYIYLKGCDIGGHNVSFDFDMLRSSFMRNAVDQPWPNDIVLVDSFRTFQKKYPHSLENAVMHYLGEEIEGSHRALADTIAAASVIDAQMVCYDYETIIEMKRSSLAPYIDVDKRFYKDEAGRIMIGFGKYEGQQLRHIMQKDRSYTTWMKDNLSFFSLQVVNHVEQIMLSGR